jgi:hypothetical protein
MSVTVLKSILGWPTGTYLGTETYSQVTHRYFLRYWYLFSGDPSMSFTVLKPILRWPTGAPHGTEMYSQVTHPCFWQYWNLFSGDLPLLFAVLKSILRWPSGVYHGVEIYDPPVTLMGAKMLRMHGVFTPYVCMAWDLVEYQGKVIYLFIICLYFNGAFCSSYSVEWKDDGWVMN